MAHPPPENGELLPKSREERINWAYKVAADTQKAQARFDAWADNYDRDVEDLLGWSGPQATLKFVIDYVGRNDRILDAGAGTGLMGQLLREKGYNHLVATDISRKMLIVAEKKAIYRDHFLADLTQPLPINDEVYDCVLSVGVSGYMNCQTLREFTRLLKPGGVILYTISDQHFEEEGFKDVVDDLVRDNQLKIEKLSDPFAAIPKSEPDHLARVHIYRKV